MIKIVNKKEEKPKLQSTILHRLSRKLRHMKRPDPRYEKLLYSYMVDGNDFKEVKIDYDQYLRLKRQLKNCSELHIHHIGGKRFEKLVEFYKRFSLFLLEDYAVYYLHKENLILVFVNR